jgi:hypothetical protein
MVGAIREFAEARGYTVRGFGVTSGNAKAHLHTLEQAVGRNPRKALALESVMPGLKTTELKPADELATTKHKPQPTAKLGINI